jgi:hypothetical protein
MSSLRRAHLSATSFDNMFRAVALCKSLSRHFLVFLLYNIFMKNLTKTIIIIVLLILAALLTWAMFFKKAEAPQVVVPSQTVPANWKMFTDSTSGISLRTPPDFFVTDVNNVFSDMEIFTLAIPTTTPYMHTHLLHEAFININAPTSTCAVEEQTESSSSTQAVINGIQFTRTTTGGVGAGNIYQGIDYTTTKNGLCYRVGLFTHSTNGEGFYTNDPVQIKKIDALQAIDIKDMFTLFDQIAGTIKFTK